MKAEQPIGETFVIVNKIGYTYVVNNALDQTYRDVWLKSQRVEFNQEHAYYYSPYRDLILRTFLDESLGLGSLSLKGTWDYDTSNAIPVLQGMLAGAVALQSAEDLLTETGISNALQLSNQRYGQRGLGVFVALEAFDKRAQTGSYIDSKGFNFVGGPAANYDSAYGHFLVGLFAEVGSSDYDTTETYKDKMAGVHNIVRVLGHHDVKASGKFDYLGAGLLFRYDFNPGYYLEASMKTGWFSNDFASPDMGPQVKFIVDGRYHALHGGVGYRFAYKPGLMMDVYGKAYWTNMGEETVVTPDGETLHFNEANFARTRLGVRYTLELAKALGLNLGGAWDYNFVDTQGLFKGSVEGIPIAPGNEPSLRGTSGFLEMGLDFKPYEDVGLSVSLSGKAFLGNVSGGSGTLTLKYVPGGLGVASMGVAPSSGDAPGRFAGPGGAKWARDAASDYYLVAQANDGASSEGSESYSGFASDSSASSALEPVTVYTEPDWKKVLSPGTVSVVVPDDYQGEQKTLNDLLDIVPGLHVNSRGGGSQYTTVNVRGSTAAQVNVYVDGVPQNLGGDAAVDISLFTAENVARVEVYKGYVPVRFVGAPIGGVINIVTKKPSDQQTTLSAGIRSYGGLKANALFTSPLTFGSFMFAATRDQGDGDFRYKYWRSEYLAPPTYDDYVNRRRKNNSHKKTDVMAKWQTEHVSIQANYKEMDRYYPTSTAELSWPIAHSGLVDLDLDKDPWSVNRRNRQLVIDRDVMVGYRNDFGDFNFGLEFNYKNQTKKFNWEDGPAEKTQQGPAQEPGLVWSTYDVERLALNLDASYKLGETNMLEFRGSVAQEQMLMNGNEWNHPSALNVYTISMATLYEQKVTHLQLQDTITMDDDLWLTVILRAHRVQATGFDLTMTSTQDGSKTPSPYSEGFPTDDGKWNYSWGLAVKKEITESLTLKSTGGTFIRYPNFYELFGDGVYIRPSMHNLEEIPLPVPERGQQWDFTADWRGRLPFVGLPANLSVSYFYRRTENMIGLFQTPAYVYYGNYGLTRAHGVELEAGLNSTYLDLTFSGTFLESKVVDLIKIKGNNRYSMWFSEGAAILNSPKWETFLRADFRVPWVDGLTLFSEYHYTDKVPTKYTNDNAYEFETALSIVNAGLKFKVFDSLLITAGVNDVFNESINQGRYSTFTKNAVKAYETSTMYFPKEGRVGYFSVQYTF